MPAPATSSRHLYTEHRRGHIQAAPRLRAPPRRAFVPGPPTDPSFDAIVISFRCVSSGSHMFVFSSHTPPRYSETSPAALTTPALDRRSLRWFGISACTATPEDLPPSLAQHGSCRRSSTSSSLPFRTHVGAHNSVVGADQGFRAPSWDQESVRDSGHEDSASAPIAAGQRPRPSFRHPHPVSMPSLFRFDASAVVHTCSSSHRTPAPLTARRQPQRSPPRLLTDAACGGLESPPPRRPRRTHLHHWHSTDRADDLLHRHHFPSGHTWVPIIRSWALTGGFALHPGTRNRYEIRCTRTQHRPASRQVNDRGRVSGTHTACCTAATTDRSWPTRTGPCLVLSRQPGSHGGEPTRSSGRRPCCAGTGGEPPDTGPNSRERRAVHPPPAHFVVSSSKRPTTTPPGATTESPESSRASATALERRARSV